MRHRNPGWSELYPSVRRKIRTYLRVMLRDNKFNEAALQRDIRRQAENKTSDVARDFLDLLRYSVSFKRRRNNGHHLARHVKPLLLVKSYMSNGFWSNIISIRSRCELTFIECELIETLETLYSPQFKR